MNISNTMAYDVAVKKIAVCIDAENVSADHANKITAKISSYGDVLIQRAYADWSMNNTKKWKDAVLNSPIQAIQQFHEKDKKESVDKAIIMDGIEIAIKNPEIDTFCLVSSDKGYSDFVLKLRSMGKYVLGIGEKRNVGENSRYVKACNEFVYIEDLQEFDETALLSPDTEGVSKDDIEFSLSKFIAQCFEATPKVEDTVLLSRLGDTIRKQQSDFDCGKYGFSGLIALVRHFSDDYDISRNEDGCTWVVTKKKTDGTETPADVSGDECVGTIFRRISTYGFVRRDGDDKEYFYYRNDSPEEIRDSLKKDVRVRFKVLEEPSDTGKNGRVVIIGLAEAAV